MASATSILGSPPLSTRPGRARHPRFQRRVFSCQPFSARHPLTPRWHLLSHPAMLRATPKVATPGVSEGAEAESTPMVATPSCSHPAVRKATPPLFPPGISRPAIGSTTPVRGSLDCTRPCLRDDRVGVVGPHESRRFTRPATDPPSHPAMGLTTPKGTAAGCFLRDHTSHDTHIGCVPAFYPGQTLPDPHNRCAGYFLRGANCWPSPINQAPLSFLTWPPEPRHPGAPRRVFSVRGHQKHDTHGSVAPYTFLPGLKRFVTHTWCAGYFRVHPSKIRHPPEWRWTPGGPSNADTHRRHAPFFLTRPF